MVRGDDVEDAVQEVFIRVWQKLSSFAGQSAFGTWLYRVAVNLFLRRRQSSARRRMEALDDLAVTPALAGPSPQPELAVAIERAVEQLPDGAREVFVLHDVQGYKHDEIATLLGIDSGTSRSQLHRARMLLRRYL
jgi:RNA polymerase sigma-70 factor (ECF subfamily)